MTTTKTTAADKFIASAVAEPRNLDWYEAVVHGGLYGADEKAIRSLCLESGDDFEAAKQSVIEFARFQVWRLRPDHGLGVL